MAYIIPALREKPDYVYVVDKETADNIKISLSTPSGDLYPIPKKFQKCIEYFINLTIFKKKKSIKILRIQPLISISNGGLKYLDNKTPDHANSIIGIISFGGQTKYEANIASSQLSSNLDNLKICTNIPKDTVAYIVTVKDIGASINVLIFPIPQPSTSSSPSPPISSLPLPPISSLPLPPISNSSPPRRSLPSPLISNSSPPRRSLPSPPISNSSPRISSLPSPLRSNSSPPIRRLRSPPRRRSSLPKNIMSVIPEEEGYKKYLYKYLKYKQKYLKAQQLYSKELKGGATVYSIYCPEEIYNLIQSLFPASNKTFNNLECFFLLLGPNSSYVENKNELPKKFINYWRGIENKEISINYKIFTTTYDLSSGIWTINYEEN